MKYRSKKHWTNRLPRHLQKENQRMSQEHEHKFVYQGLRWKDTKERLPGSGATTIEYYECYFCEICLEKRKDRVDKTTNSYEKPIDGSTPL